MFSQKIMQLSMWIRDFCMDHQAKITTAESCTGGLIAAAITEIPDSSKIFEYGFITYSIEAKNKILGVDLEIIRKYGVVSAEVAEMMALKVASKTCADIAIASTGYVGPCANDSAKLGHIFIGTYYYGKVLTKKLDCSNLLTEENARSKIRMKVVEFALQTTVDSF